MISSDSSLASAGDGLATLLDLPPIEIMPASHGGYGLYGVWRVAANYCGIGEPPKQVPGLWQHGWCPRWYQLDPDLILQWPTSDKKDWPAWVARQDEEVYLKGHGYRRAKAIGMPMVYITPPPVPRRPGSLLVMPAHSLDFTTHMWKFEHYVDEIDAIRKDFAEVFVCVHPSCWRRGYWLAQFRRRGYTVIKGASATDRNALTRIATLASSCEFMTTNAFGSHLVYAAFFGAKVAVHGTFVEHRADDFANDPLFLDRRPLLEASIHASSEAVLKQHVPDLFRPPKAAITMRDWAADEIGVANKLSPAAMRTVFGWQRTKLAAQAAWKVVPPPVKRRVNSALRREAAAANAFEREWRRLKVTPRHTPTTATLRGDRFELLDAETFLVDFDDVFNRKVYKFTTTSESPRIIETAAGIGLPLLYYKRLFPSSRIIALEPNPERYAVLERNCANWGLGTTEVIAAAPWTDESMVHIRTGDRVHPLVNDAPNWETFEARGLDIKSLLGEPVALFRLSSPGHEARLLAHCRTLLSNVENICVDYVSLSEQPQTVPEVLEVLRASGFRVQVRSQQSSQSPLAATWQDDVEFILQVFGRRVPR